MFLLPGCGVVTLLRHTVNLSWEFDLTPVVICGRRLSHCSLGRPHIMRADDWLSPVDGVASIVLILCFVFFCLMSVECSPVCAHRCSTLRDRSGLCEVTWPSHGLVLLS